MNLNDVKLRLAGVIRESIVDGPGIRMTVFVQGCPHHCKGCHNAHTWDFDSGYEGSVGRIIEEAVKNAIESPLLETSIEGAKAILLNIAGGYDMTLQEVTSVADKVTEAADPEAMVIFGASINENLQDEVIVTVIATGSDGSGLETGYDVEETVEYEKEKEREEVERAFDQRQQELETKVDLTGASQNSFTIPTFLKSEDLAKKDE